jgi:hypothetical protein
LAISSRTNNKTPTNAVRHVKAVDFLDVELAIFVATFDREHAERGLDTLDFADAKFAIIGKFDRVSDVDHFSLFSFV